MNAYCFGCLVTMAIFDIGTLFFDTTPWNKIKAIFWFTVILGGYAYWWNLVG